MVPTVVRHPNADCDGLPMQVVVPVVVGVPKRPEWAAAVG